LHWESGSQRTGFLIAIEMQMAQKASTLDLS
jgi:hypothetical protein